jgi:hypothetical protein
MPNPSCFWSEPGLKRQQDPSRGWFFELSFLWIGRDPMVFVGFQTLAVVSDSGGLLIVSEFLSWCNLHGFSEGNAIAEGQQIPNSKAPVDRRLLESYLR